MARFEVTADIRGTDPRLISIMRAAAEQWHGTRVVVYSGYRPGGKGNHAGWATDVRLYDENDQPIYNEPIKKWSSPAAREATARGYPAYRSFALIAKNVQENLYPGMRTFGWGGNFGYSTDGKDALDIQHFQTNRDVGSMGDWKNGLNKAGLAALGAAGQFALAAYTPGQAVASASPTYDIATPSAVQDAFSGKKVDLTSSPLEAAQEYGAPVATPVSMTRGASPVSDRARDAAIRTAYAEDVNHWDQTLSVIFNRTQDKRYSSDPLTVVSQKGPVQFVAYNNDLYRSLKPTDPVYQQIGAKWDAMQAGTEAPANQNVNFHAAGGGRNAYSGRVQPKEGSVLLTGAAPAKDAADPATVEPIDPNDKRPITFGMTGKTAVYGDKKRQEWSDAMRASVEAQGGQYIEINATGDKKVEQAAKLVEAAMAVKAADPNAVINVTAFSGGVFGTAAALPHMPAGTISEVTAIGADDMKNHEARFPGVAKVNWVPGSSMPGVEHPDLPRKYAEQFATAPHPYGQEPVRGNYGIANLRQALVANDFTKVKLIYDAAKAQGPEAEKALLAGLDHIEATEPDVAATIAHNLTTVTAAPQAVSDVAAPVSEASPAEGARAAAGEYSPPPEPTKLTGELIAGTEGHGAEDTGDIGSVATAMRLPDPRPAHGDLSPSVRALVDEVSAHGLNPTGIAKLHAAEFSAPAVPVSSVNGRQFVRQGYANWDTKHSIADRFNKAALEGDLPGMQAAYAQLGMNDAGALTSSAKRNYSPEDAKIAAANVDAVKDKLFTGFTGNMAKGAFEAGMKTAGYDFGEHGNAMPMTHPEQAGLVPVPAPRPSREGSITRDASFTPDTASPLTAAVAEPDHPDTGGGLTRSTYGDQVHFRQSAPVAHTEAPVSASLAGGLGAIRHGGDFAGTSPEIAAALADDAEAMDPKRTPTGIDRTVLTGLPDPSPMLDVPAWKVPIAKEPYTPPAPERVMRGGSRGGPIETRGGGRGSEAFASPFTSDLTASLAALDSAGIGHTPASVLSGYASQGFHMPDFTSGSGGSSMAYHTNTGTQVGDRGQVVQTGTFVDTQGHEHTYEMG